MKQSSYKERSLLSSSSQPASEQKKDAIAQREHFLRNNGWQRKAQVLALVFFVFSMLGGGGACICEVPEAMMRQGGDPCRPLVHARLR